MGFGSAIGAITGGLIGGFGSSSGARTSKTSYTYTPQQTQVQDATSNGILAALKQAQTPYNATPEYQASLNSINNIYSSPAATEGMLAPLASRGFAQSGLSAGNLLSAQLAAAGAKANAASQASIYSNENSLSRLLSAIGAGSSYGFANPQGTNVAPGSGLAGALSGAAGGAVQLPAVLKSTGLNLPSWLGGSSSSNGPYGLFEDGNYVGN